MSSWLGASVLTLGEWFIKKMPLVSYIYTASKQISTAISPGKNIENFTLVLMYIYLSRIDNLKNWPQIKLQMPSRKWQLSGIPVLGSMLLDSSLPQLFFRAEWKRKNSIVFMSLLIISILETYFLWVPRTSWGLICLSERELVCFPPAKKETI